MGDGGVLVVALAPILNGWHSKMVAWPRADVEARGRCCAVMSYGFKVHRCLLLTLLEGPWEIAMLIIGIHTPVCLAIWGGPDCFPLMCHKSDRPTHCI